MIWQFHCWVMSSNELKAGSQRDVCPPMSTAALFTEANRWRPPRCPSTDKRIHQVWSIHIVEGHSALRRKERLAPATTWVNLVLNEISQSQKDKYFMIPLV